VSNLAIELLSVSDAKLFSEVYEIYCEAIPSSERKSFEQLRRMQQASNYKIFIARNSADILGFTILYILEQSRLVLLEYMAVSQLHRGKGIGGQLFQYSMNQVLDASEAGTLLIEVDSDRPSCPEPDREGRQRRVDFYRRLGCQRIEGLSYILPLETDTKPPEMDLLVFMRRRCALSREQLRLWLSDIYEKVYGMRRDDPRIQHMLTGVAETLMLS
jgi:hypothetical protein